MAQPRQARNRPDPASSQFRPDQNQFRRGRFVLGLVDQFDVLPAPAVLFAAFPSQSALLYM
jgi:hypothetical protein